MMHPNSRPHRHPHPNMPPFPRTQPRRPVPPPPPEEFAVLLRRPLSDPKPLKLQAVEALIASCPSPHGDPLIFPCGDVAAKLLFPHWDDAVEALFFLWRRRLRGDHCLAPLIEKRRCARERRQELWSDEVERMRDLFLEHVAGVVDGSEVASCKEKVHKLDNEIRRCKCLLSRPQRMQRSLCLQQEKKSLEAEAELLNGRLEEFRVSMEGILSQIRGDDVREDGDTVPLNIGGSLNWVRIHSRVLRECQRLSDGLPIYSFRRMILRNIKSSQVTILIGETGSGKSTQLVQFLADSGPTATGSIVCTQPRKIAAISLAQRVGEESIGCYTDNFVVSYPSYSSSQVFDSKIIFMTDHCLLQHYMRAKNFDDISYIVVDEAHERSLNTDLLLALIKKELPQRLDLRLIIMSATADASKLADYFDGCCTVHVTGRSFPVDIKYVPDVSSDTAWSMVPKLISGFCAPYVSDVIKVVSKIHKEEPGGAILAFLTSQMEVEWACENFIDPSAVVLPMHGKLSHEYQYRVMKTYQDKRKIIFATNVAETSLTIQGVRYVVDSGMVKESRFDPGSGMNVLKVGRISQSSANQRAGRAGRTGPGKCYRLYSEFDFKSMNIHQEPEIRKVHLGNAILRILALGLKNMKEFDFIDAPNQKAIEKATENLINLGAVICKFDVFKLTSTGRSLVNLGIEPRLGKIILDCCGLGLKREGLVLAALMANSSSIFCRVGTNEDKYKADCLKVSFCHRGGDLFTLLSVYKEWEDEAESRNQWCWQHSINAKSMRRCKETVKELESCLQHELNTIIPSYWKWDPHKSTDVDCLLKKVILSSLVENVAMYSGSDLLGYEVAATGQYLQLHPSCSLLVYGQKPSWVVFFEILSVTNQYLACVTAVDYDDVRNIQLPLYDVVLLESRKMQMNVITAVGDSLLKKFCGKSFCNLNSVVSSIQKDFMDERISITVDFDRKEIQLFAMPKDMEKITCILTDILDCEKNWSRDECIEKCLFHGGHGTSPSVALFGSGAEIKHLELDKRYLTVEISHQDAYKLNEKELLRMVEQHAPGIAGFSKHSVIGQEGPEPNKVGKITFLSPESAENAVAKLNGVEFHGSLLKVLPVRSGNQKILPPSAVRAKVFWPRRRSKGVAFVRCAEEDAEFIVQDCFALVLGGRYANCKVSSSSRNWIFVSNIPRDLSEKEIYEGLRSMTSRRIFPDVKVLKEEVTNTISTATCAEALRREISPFMPKKHDPSQHFQVEVFNPASHDPKFRALLTFDGSLHLEAAKALDHLQGKVLSGCQPWQKVECRHEFYSSVFCPPRIYAVIREELYNLVESFKCRKGVYCSVEETITGSCKVKITAHATKTVADLRMPLEKLTRGKTITHTGLSPTNLKFLLSRDGLKILRSVERETGTYIFYDRQNINVRLFGPPSSVANAEEKLVRDLLSFHQNKFLEIRLRGHNLPPDLMKEVVQRFGADLHGLREKVPGVSELSLHLQRHAVRVKGTKEQKQQVEEIITRLAELTLGAVPKPASVLSGCPICLCELEEPYQLEACGHEFCRACLVDQCESVSHSRDGFPLCCTKSGCNQPLLLADLKSLLTSDKLEELFRASVVAFVSSSEGLYRFCPSPDCPGVYRVAAEDMPEEAVGPFVCGACSVETCTKCHLEYHPFISCEKYKNFKDVPDNSLVEWRKGKGHVKDCPSCGHTIEKTEGCNHIECRCGTHICWVCLEYFKTSDECYAHLRAEDHV
ncbi:ATP-dependent RNA helicase DEAH12, chloroplastic-like [Iris pallida]|uniref:RNA helicase n=1 Tax=Iris pallida TaxID=29817 RepID=A0AAX6DMK7_IRIPA|nr:ATP-dependent RNA helicase DEAH12, chloroplastic-like [Iris pallida]